MRRTIFVACMVSNPHEPLSDPILQMEQGRAAASEKANPGAGEEVQLVPGLLSEPKLQPDQESIPQLQSEGCKPGSEKSYSYKEYRIGEKDRSRGKKCGYLRK